MVDKIILNSLIWRYIFKKKKKKKGWYGNESWNVKKKGKTEKDKKKEKELEHLERNALFSFFFFSSFF